MSRFFYAHGLHLRPISFVIHPFWLKFKVAFKILSEVGFLENLLKLLAATHHPFLFGLHLVINAAFIHSLVIDI